MAKLDITFIIERQSEGKDMKNQKLPILSQGSIEDQIEYMLSPLT